MRIFSILLGLVAVLMTAEVALAGSRVPGSFEVANACAASCRAAHNQCRIATKGSGACDARLQACLSGCLRR